MAQEELAEDLTLEDWQGIVEGALGELDILKRQGDALAKEGAKLEKMLNALEQDNRRLQALVDNEEEQWLNQADRVTRLALVYKNQCQHLTKLHIRDKARIYKHRNVWNLARAQALALRNYYVSGDDFGDTEIDFIDFLENVFVLPERTEDEKD